MKLKSIQIINYRSIDELDFELSKLNDGSCTYGLIGVNEAGKSSILCAIGLKDGISNDSGEPLPRQKDFRNDSDLVSIRYNYSLDKEEVDTIYGILNEQANEDTEALPKKALENVVFTVSFNRTSPTNRILDIELGDQSYADRLDSSTKAQIMEFVEPKVHKTVFWRADKRYMISGGISLTEFKANPATVSVPLKNCFLLAGIKDIQKKISDLGNDSTKQEALEEELGEAVTEHINSVWPGHPINITFKINGDTINFHVKDRNVKGRAKTADQRSDGFAQFVSFLLTTSAENKNEELSNTILLLDEPETHLHPTAQENILEDIIRISKNERGNLVFFATHSNYMIDKQDLSRNYKISKTGDVTKKSQFDSKKSTYASVSYEVFEVSSTDYHNQLYDELREEYAKNKSKEADEINIKKFDEEFFKQIKKLKMEHPFKGKPKSATLPTYIRNSIHYPINKDGDFERNLVKSTLRLKEYLEEIGKKPATK